MKFFSCAPRMRLPSRLFQAGCTRAARLGMALVLLNVLGPAAVPSCSAQGGPGRTAEERNSARAGEPSIELSAPHGLLLTPSKLTLSWRTAERGPFRVTVLDKEGATVYTASTFGHEMRLLVGSFPDALKAGRAYRWRVEPELSPGGPDPPYAEFSILDAEESAEAKARFEKEARELGVGEEAREPEGELALAKLYLQEGFYAEAERELERLVERGWDDPRIRTLLAEIYRKTGRAISLRELSTGTG